MGADYDTIYRQVNPRRFPFSPFERQIELRDLWPDEQENFRKVVDAALANPAPPVKETEKS